MLFRLFPGSVITAFTLVATPALATGPKPAAHPRITLFCPLKSGITRTIDLSTGVANWQVSGRTFDPAVSKAGIVDMASAPPFWAGVPIPGAKWVQPFPGAATGGVLPGQHIFFVTFDVKKYSGAMHILIQGNAIADEAFSVEFLEAGPGNPSQGGMNADAPAPGKLRTQDMFDFDYVVGEASRSKNPPPGRYALRVIVENGMDYGGSMGLLAHIKLTQTCLGRRIRAVAKATD